MTAHTGAAVLISGASFAGLATAHWMSRLGYRVTLVELADGLRNGGSPVDIEGETLAILERMGLLAAVRAKALPPRRLEFKDVDDNLIGSLEPAAAGGEKYEIHRDDLLAILFDAVVASCRVVFRRSVRHLEQSTEGVTVTFDDGSRDQYALVFGCDGNRSNTRRLTFGDDPSFVRFMACYFFIKVVPQTGLLPPNVSQIFSVPGRTALLNGYEDRTDIALAFRSDVEIAYDHRDRAQQRRMVQDHFLGLGWKVPALLEHFDADDDFYFDRVNQIRMPSWSKGRVVLVGDAGYCVSPVAGMGGSVALIGAAALANALACHGGDHAAAFRDYDNKLRPFVDQVQEKAVSFGMAMMFPADDAEIAERDRRLRSGALNV